MTAGGDAGVPVGVARVPCRLPPHLLRRVHHRQHGEGAPRHCRQEPDSRRLDEKAGFATRLD